MTKQEQAQNLFDTMIIKDKIDAREEEVKPVSKVFKINK